jgi:hypothetical protein
VTSAAKIDENLLKGRLKSRRDTRFCPVVGVQDLSRPDIGAELGG